MQLASNSDPRLWDPLCLVDEREASRVRRAGGRHCGGALHSARYARRPRGVPRGGCLRGTGSGHAAQFLLRGVSASDEARLGAHSGRRVNVGLLALLLPVLLGHGSPMAVSAACRRLGLSRRTLRRWRRWWQETFADSAFWRAQRGLPRRQAAYQEHPCSAASSVKWPPEKHTCSSTGTMDASPSRR